METFKFDGIFLHLKLAKMQDHHDNGMIVVEPDHIIALRSGVDYNTHTVTPGVLVINTHGFGFDVQADLEELTSFLRSRRTSDIALYELWNEWSALHAQRCPHLGCPGRSDVGYDCNYPRPYSIYWYVPDSDTVVIDE